MSLETDQQLLQIVSDPKATTIAEVIDRMNRIDTVLPAADGLKWFNWLYRLVTFAVKNNPPLPAWDHPQWIAQLDVVFANLYFAAIELALSGQNGTPRSWRALFDARHNGCVDRIQFAMAGMNAHINHDLSLALLQMDEIFGFTPAKTSPEHADYEHINILLAGLLPEALNTLATGIVGELAQDTCKIGQLLALWNVQVARDFAWDFAGHLRDLTGPRRQFALAAQDQTTGVIGRALLAI
jgi:hypothetical protein